jgi:hypothetical protein
VGRAAQQATDIDAQQGSRYEAEEGQDGVAASDVGGVEKRVSESMLPGSPFERRSGIGDGDELRTGLVACRGRGVVGEVLVQQIRFECPPDFDDTMNSVCSRLIRCETKATAPGTVESSTCSLGKPGVPPITWLSTSAPRLLPPIPRRTTSTNPSPLARSANETMEPV